MNGRIHVYFIRTFMDNTSASPSSWWRFNNFGICVGTTMGWLFSPVEDSWDNDGMLVGILVGDITMSIDYGPVHSPDSNLGYLQGYNQAFTMLFWMAQVVIKTQKNRAITEIGIRNEENRRGTFARISWEYDQQKLPNMRNQQGWWQPVWKVRIAAMIFRKEFWVPYKQDNIKTRIWQFKLYDSYNQIYSKVQN